MVNEDRAARHCFANYGVEGCGKNETDGDERPWKGISLSLSQNLRNRCATAPEDQGNQL